MRWGGCSGGVLGGGSGRLSRGGGCSGGVLGGSGGVWGGGVVGVVVVDEMEWV